MNGWPSKDFLIEVEKGNIPGHSLVHKFGRNPAVPNGSFAYIDPLGMTAFPLSSATTVRVKAGGNANDTAAGSGARSVTVEGVDSSGLHQTETIATAGASASSATTKSFLRVYRAYVSEVGTYGGANTAAITIENSAGGTDIATILTGEGQTQTSLYTIPSDCTGYFLGMEASVDGLKGADVKVFTRKDITNTTTNIRPKRILLYFDGVLGEHSYNPRSPTKINGNTDIWVESSGDGNITQVSVNYEILLVKS